MHDRRRHVGHHGADQFGKVAGRQQRHLPAPADAGDGHEAVARVQGVAHPAQRLFEVLQRHVVEVLRAVFIVEDAQRQALVAARGEQRGARRVDAAR